MKKHISRGKGGFYANISLGAQLWATKPTSNTLTGIRIWALIPKWALKYAKWDKATCLFRKSKYAKSDRLLGELPGSSPPI